MKDSLSNLIGCTPTDIVDTREYRLALNKVRNDEFWPQSFNGVDTPYGPFGYEILYEHNRTFQRTMNSIRKFTGSSLAKHGLTAELALAPVQLGSPLPSSYFFPFWPNEEDFVKRSKPSSLDTFLSSIKILSEILSTSNRKITPLRRMYSYDIPIGHSHVRTAQQLDSIIKSAKTIAVAPLVASTARVSNAIAVGHHVVALDPALTGDSVIPIFIGTIALA